MAKIIENQYGRRMIRLSSMDIQDVVREYQNLQRNSLNNNKFTTLKENIFFYLPEDL